MIQGGFTLNKLKKHYKLLCSVFLLLVLVLWTAFLNRDYVKINKENDQKLDNAVNNQSKDTDKGTDRVNVSTSDTEIPNTEPEPTREPTSTPTPSPEPSPVPTPTPEPTLEPAVVAPPTPTPVAKQSYIPVFNPSVKFEYCVTNVTQTLNMRSGAGSENKVVGKFGPNCYAKILERGSSWTKLSSNSVTGYSSTDYLLFDLEAIDAMRSQNALFIETSTTVNLRKGPTTDYDVIVKASAKERFPYLPEYSVDGWYAVRYDSSTIAYLSQELCEVVITMDGLKKTE